MLVGKENMREELTNRQKQAIETKRRLYKSAVGLFREYPFDEVKITDICEKADVSVGVFYHYFKSKKDILYEGYVNFDRDLDESIQLIKNKDPIESISLIIEKYHELTNERGTSYRNAFLRNELEMKYEDFASSKRPFYKAMLKYVDQAIESNKLVGDASEITNDILRCNKGVVYNWCLYEGNFNLIEEGIKITHIILNYYSNNND